MMADRSRPDHYARKAKNEGKAARSIYKLEEIDQRWHLLRGGQKVLDLGCAPGSWMQYAAAKVGASGSVRGYDLKPVDVSLPPWAVAEVGDVFELGRSGALSGPYDVVLSDMAPSTMGDHKTDALRSAALAESALDLAARHLRPGGNVVVKVLEGKDVPEMIKGLRAAYERVELLRPKATRKESTEIFLIGLGKRGPAGA
jgi:23S rRNA (uridine2552-2'-O)-methyltransferase